MKKETRYILIVSKVNENKPSKCYEFTDDELINAKRLYKTIVLKNIEMKCLIDLVFCDILSKENA